MKTSAVRGVARFAIAAWVATLGACMADAPAVDPVDEPTASTSAATTSAATTSALTPAVTTVFECSTTGNWWATRAICQANCAGGTCFACGLDCQN